MSGANRSAGGQTCRCGMDPVACQRFNRGTGSQTRRSGFNKIWAVQCSTGGVQDSGGRRRGVDDGRVVQGDMTQVNPKPTRVWVARCRMYACWAMSIQLGWSEYDKRAALGSAISSTVANSNPVTFYFFILQNYLILWPTWHSIRTLPVRNTVATNP